MPKLNFSAAVRNKIISKGSGVSPARHIVKTDKVVYGVSSAHPHVKRNPIKYKPPVATVTKGKTITISTGVFVKPVTSVDATTLVEPRKAVYGIKEKHATRIEAEALPSKSQKIPDTITLAPKEPWRK
jgi:hypothetical protein